MKIKLLLCSLCFVPALHGMLEPDKMLDASWAWYADSNGKEEYKLLPDTTEKKVPYQEDTINCRQENGELWLNGNDGHGGPHDKMRVCDKLRDNLYKNFRQNIARGLDVESAIKASFVTEEKWCVDNKAQCNNGSTAVVVYIDANNQAHFAWAGDSRAVLYGKGTDGDGSVQFATRDHDIESEIARIEQCVKPGLVIDTSLTARERFDAIKGYYKDKNVGLSVNDACKQCHSDISLCGHTAGSFPVYRINGLNMSRSVGDCVDGKASTKANPVGNGCIIATPDYQKIGLTSDSTFLIIASDGIWDVIESKEALKIAHVSWAKAILLRFASIINGFTSKNIISKSIIEEQQSDNAGDLHLAAKALIAEAKKRGSRDNLSAIVVKLNWQNKIQNGAWSIRNMALGMFGVFASGAVLYNQFFR